MRRVLLLVTLLAGCSFPDPAIEDDIVDTGIDSNADTSSDSSVAETAVEDSSADADGDVEFQDSATDVKVDAADTADPCDKDRDGFKAKGGTCGGTDCDDNDSNARPNITMFQTFNSTGKPHGGDWNCDGNIEKQFNINVNCGLLGGSACNATKGFTGDPVCGTSAKYVQCATSGILCVESTSTMQIQGCK